MKTTLFSVLAAAVRVGALLYIAAAAAELLSYALRLAAGTDTLYVFGLAGGIASIVFAGLLWFYPGLLVRPAVGRAAHEVFESPLRAEDIQRIGLCLLGVWLATDGVLDFSYLLLRSGAASYTLDNIDLLRSARAELISAALSALAGIALTLGSRGLVGLLQRLRGRPVQPVSDPEAED